MTKTEAIVTEIYDAWRRQDLDLLASYLPDDFCHVIHIPTDLHPLGGTSCGKGPSLKRLGLIAAEFDFLSFDTGDLMIHKERAGAEIPVRYRHRRTGAVLETVIANFWTFEQGWPVKLSEYHDLGRIQAFAASLAAVGAAPGR
jgi:ketosteroid isomerase-like protein